MFKTNQVVIYAERLDKDGFQELIYKPGQYVSEDTAVDIAKEWSSSHVKVIETEGNISEHSIPFGNSKAPKDPNATEIDRLKAELEASKASEAKAKEASKKSKKEEDKAKALLDKTKNK